MRGFSSSFQQHTPPPHILTASTNSLFTCHRRAIHRVPKCTPSSERMAGKMVTSPVPDLKYYLFNRWTNSHDQVTLLVAMDTQVKGFWPEWFKKKKKKRATRVLTRDTHSLF